MLEICPSERLWIDLISWSSCVDPPGVYSHLISADSAQGFNLSSTVTSGVLGHSQVLLNHRGDRQSVVHLLIGCCAKGGPRHWLQLIRCAYLQSGV